MCKYQQQRVYNLFSYQGLSRRKIFVCPHTYISTIPRVQYISAIPKGIVHIRHTQGIVHIRNTQIILHIHHTQSIVCVHADVDQAVEEGAQEAGPTCHILHTCTNTSKHLPPTQMQTQTPINKQVDFGSIQTKDIYRVSHKIE